MSAKVATGRGPGQSALSFLLGELKPKGKLLTPFNVITAPIILAGIAFIIVRFAKGLGAVTNLSQEFPWGIWIGFDVVTGVAFAGGAYVITVAVYVFGIKRFHPIARATVLSGFLAYAFYTGALMLDLGRPWNIVNPIIGNEFGVNSVMFLVAWHFMLYLMAEFVEFSPAITEWLGLKKVRRIASGLTLGAVILGFTLSFLHQSGLGALFLLAKGKIHPLWYSEFLPVQFLVSSVFAGMSMMIVEGSISHRVFKHRVDAEHGAAHRDILFGVAKIAVGAMFAYLGMQGIVVIHGAHAGDLATGWGAWWLLEVVGFVAVPMLVFAAGIRRRSVPTIVTASVLTGLGIILNRLNVSVIAFKWYEPHHYVPAIGEYVVTAAVICAEIWAFRWIVLRMPVLGRDAGEVRE
ncbi:MAG: polysulfide reductase NrfD [Proteobacteria bacterium]|jgi:Ni/Fe-hydrogenase subunit HybB-like protein|nr:polysulfide reductase NrfD [Pseudomonadota bacterium]